MHFRKAAETFYLAAPLKQGSVLGQPFRPTPSPGLVAHPKGPLFSTGHLGFRSPGNPQGRPGCQGLEPVRRRPSDGGSPPRHSVGAFRENSVVEAEVTVAIVRDIPNVIDALINTGLAGRHKWGKSPGRCYRRNALDRFIFARGFWAGSLAKPSGEGRIFGTPLRGYPWGRALPTAGCGCAILAGKTCGHSNDKSRATDTNNCSIA